MDHRSNPQGRHFAQPSVNRSPYVAAIHFFFQPLHGHARRRPVAAQLVELACELLDMSSSLIAARALLSFQTVDRIALAIGRRPALLRIGYAPVQVQFGNHARVVHFADSLRFRLRKLGRRFRLPVMRARFLQGILGSLLVLHQRLLLRCNLFFAGMDLRICPRQLRLLFSKLELLCARIKLNQNISSLDFLIKHQMGRNHPAADHRFHWMRRPIHFQLRLIRDRVDRHARQKEPNNPQGQQGGRQRESQVGPPRVVGFERANRAKEGGRHSKGVYTTSEGLWTVRRSGYRRCTLRP